MLRYPGKKTGSFTKSQKCKCVHVNVRREVNSLSVELAMTIFIPLPERLCLRSNWVVCQQDYRKSTDPIFTGGKVRQVPRTHSVLYVVQMTRQIHKNHFSLSLTL